VRPGTRYGSGETRFEDNQRAFQAARKLEVGGAMIDDIPITCPTAAASGKIPAMPSKK
jgi:hypothetical protein